MNVDSSDLAAHNQELIEELAVLKVKHHTACMELERLRSRSEGDTSTLYAALRSKGKEIAKGNDLIQEQAARIETLLGVEVNLRSQLSGLETDRDELLAALREIQDTDALRNEDECLHDRTDALLARYPEES